MYQYLQRTFLKRIPDVSRAFKSACRDAALDIKGTYELSSQLAIYHYNRKYPKTFKKGRSVLTGFLMQEELTSPYITTPLSAVAALISPIPGDGAIHTANAIRGLGRIHNHLRSHFDGSIQRREQEKLRDVMQSLNSKENQHIVDPQSFEPD